MDKTLSALRPESERGPVSAETGRGASSTALLDHSPLCVLGLAPMRATTLLALVAGLTGAFLAGCREKSKPPGPDDVVAAFISAMSRTHGTPDAGEQVVALLWEPARDNLEERAARASALSGRELQPGELIAPSWFSLHVVPERYEARIDGDWAEVTVVGTSGARVKARCRREDDQWKVALELPPLPPIRQREKSSGRD